MKKWNNEEINLLKKYYELNGGEFVAKITKHPLNSVYDKAIKLGIKCKKSKYNINRKSFLNESFFENGYIVI